MKYHRIRATGSYDSTSASPVQVRGNKKTARRKKIELVRLELERKSATPVVRAKELRIMRGKLAARMDEITSLQQKIRRLQFVLEDTKKELEEYKLLWENRKVRKESSGRNNLYTAINAQDIWKEYVYEGKTIRGVADAHSYMDGNGKETKMSTKTCTELIHQYDDQFCTELVTLQRFIDVRTKEGRAENKQLHRIVKRLQKSNPEYADKIRKFMI